MQAAAARMAVAAAARQPEAGPQRSQRPAPQPAAQETSAAAVTRRAATTMGRRAERAEQPRRVATRRGLPAGAPEPEERAALVSTQAATMMAPAARQARRIWAPPMTARQALPTTARRSVLRSEPKILVHPTTRAAARQTRSRPNPRTVLPRVRPVQRLHSRMARGAAVPATRASARPMREAEAALTAKAPARASPMSEPAVRTLPARPTMAPVLGQPEAAAARRPRSGRTEPSATLAIQGWRPRSAPAEGGQRAAEPEQEEAAQPPRGCLDSPLRSTPALAPHLTTPARERLRPGGPSSATGAVARRWSGRLARPEWRPVAGPRSSRPGRKDQPQQESGWPDGPEGRPSSFCHGAVASADIAHPRLEPPPRGRDPRRRFQLASGGRPPLSRVRLEIICENISLRTRALRSMPFVLASRT